MTLASLDLEINKLGPAWGCCLVLQFFLFKLSDVRSELHHAESASSRARKI